MATYADQYVVTGLRLLSDEQRSTDEVARIKRLSNSCHATALDREDRGDENGAAVIGDKSCALAAIGRALEARALSEFDLDYCLYYLSFVLDDETRKELLKMAAAG